LEGARHHCRSALRLLLRDRAADGVLGAALRDEDHGDALFAQRAEEPMSGPGTPIMPVPSRLTSATRSMLVMPFTGSAEAGWAQMSDPAFSGAKVLRIQIGMRSFTAGAMVCG